MGSDKKKAPASWAGLREQSNKTGDTLSLGPGKVKGKSEIFLKTFSKYALHDEAQRLVRQLVPEGNNFTKCVVCPRSSSVNVVRNPTMQRAYFRQVVTCSNSFLCPVCAPRIRSKRSKEIGVAVDKWLARSETALERFRSPDPDKTLYMITLTFQHSKRDKLSDIMPKFKSATQFFWRHRMVRDSFRKAGIQGRITAFEITHGSNGWHPHLHILVFCHQHYFDVPGFRRLWVDALTRAGLSGSEKCALNFIEARNGSEYINKISLEIGLSNAKQGREGGLSQFQLLENSASGDRVAGKLFQELWLYMRDSRTHSLEWSKGLKAFFGVSEVSDEEICSGLDEGFVSFACIASGLYRRCTTEDKSALLAFASMGDSSQFARYLSLVILREHLERDFNDVKIFPWRLAE